MIIFNGEQQAVQKEQLLQQKIAQLGRKIKIAAILFSEDKASVLYTRLKKEAAKRMGIDYVVSRHHLAESVESVIKKINEFNQDLNITGIMIQKPNRQAWTKYQGINETKGQKAVRQAFASWWEYLTTNILLSKDVDGLHPQSLKAVQDNSRQQRGLMMPATARGVLWILKTAFQALKLQKKEKELMIFVLGRSDIVGLPVYYQLKNLGYKTKNITTNDFKQRIDSGRNLLEADVIISATGKHQLITAELVKKGVIIIDVGEPKPDVDFKSVKDKAAFITPVPGGVGPMTVISLLENAFDLRKSSIQIELSNA